MRGMCPAELRRRLYWASDRWPERLRFRSIAFMRRSSAEVGSFGSFSYVSLSLNMLRILLSYWVLSRTTVQLPLSAGKMASDGSDFICLRSFVSSGFKLLEELWLFLTHLQCEFLLCFWLPGGLAI